MNNIETNDNTDELLDELKNLNKVLDTELKEEKEKNNTTIQPLSTTNLIVSPLSTNKTTITENNINEFILEKSEELIQESLDTIKSLKPIIKYTADAKSMSGFAEILKATTAALDTLNAINIEKRKAQTAKELKNMDVKKKIEGPKSVTNNIIADRETIIKMLKNVEDVEEQNNDYPVLPN